MKSHAFHTALAGALAVACSTPPRPQVVRVQISPDGKRELRVVRVNPGAASDYVYGLHIVERGYRGPLRPGDSKLTATNVANLRVGWADSLTIEVSYDQADIAHFTNSWTDCPSSAARRCTIGYIRLVGPR